MQVYGYTEKKKLYTVELPVEEIVAAEIDPWRVDLFDPDPVRKTVNKKLLHFRRLRGLSFAYKKPDSLWIVGTHDGNGEACFAGLAQTDSPGEVTLHPIVASDKSFREHWAEYLEMWTKRHQHRGWPSKLRGTKVFEAKANTAVKIKGATLIFDWLEPDLKSLNPSFPFAGEMFTEVSLPVSLPPELSLVFSSFPGIAVAIVGDAPRKAIDNEPITEVEIVFVDWSSYPQVDAAIERLPIDSGSLVYPDVREREFSIGGCRYKTHLSIFSNLHDWRQAHKIALSNDGLYCEKPNNIMGTRISWFDVAKRQTRGVSVCGCNLLRRNNEDSRRRKQLLDEQRIKIVQIGKLPSAKPRS
jgi:hypothetical protein